MSVKFVAEQDTDIDAPIAVIGGGACELTAAIAAAQDGGEVYLFERGKSPAGSTAMSYGAICGAGMKIERRLRALPIIVPKARLRLGARPLF